MKREMIIAAAVAAVSLPACGSSYPVPTQRMADAQSAHRSAMELGADKQPAAQLHLKLAEEQIAKANILVKDNENRRADIMLIRAKADAELALSLAKEQKSTMEALQAIEQSNAQAAMNASQGAQ